MSNNKLGAILFFISMPLNGIIFANGDKLFAIILIACHIPWYVTEVYNKIDK